MPAPKQKNYEHLALLCSMINNPDIPVKLLNTLFALRLSWGSKGFFNQRELQRLAQINEKHPTLKEETKKPEKQTKKTRGQNAGR